MLLFLLLACEPSFDPNRCGWQDRFDPRCPCADRAYSLTAHADATCRPDQTSRIEWEPQNGPRDENEDRVGGVLLCTCKEMTTP